MLILLYAKSWLTIIDIHKHNTILVLITRAIITHNYYFLE